MAPRFFFSIFYFNFHLFFKYETIKTHARKFLSLIISAVGVDEVGWKIKFIDTKGFGLEDICFQSKLAWTSLKVKANSY